MRKTLLLNSCFFILSMVFGLSNGLAQGDESYYVSPEFLFGKTGPSNRDFPEIGWHKSLFFSIANTNVARTEEWIERLNVPSTGISVGFSDFGNLEAIGSALTVMPFIEFDLYPSKSRFKLNMGLGMSRFSTKFDEVTNRFNRGVSTSYTWSFRSYFLYDLLKKHPERIRLGLGYFHQSNGHTKLPNQGLNTFSLSLSTRIIPYKNVKPSRAEATKLTSDRQYYFSMRTGIGLHILTYDDFLHIDIADYNEPKEVYTIAAGGGIIINKFLKLGGGFHYRFYEHYYDYIQRNNIEPYNEAPFLNATNFGIYFGGELLLSHVGMEFQMGLNIYKPFYREEWLLNEKELNWYYELKKHVPARLGLKLYAINTNDQPRHNIFIGATINANLGQADFTELSLGYVRRFDLR